MPDTMRIEGAVKASVIIPSYNRAAALERTLLALAEQTLPPDAFEVVVVDDGSVDGSADKAAARQFLCDVRLLRQHNRGPAAARNAGARGARADLLVFLDADMIPAPGLVEAYVTAFAMQPEAIHIGRILAWPAAFETLFDRVTRVEMTHDLGAARRELAFYHLASGNFALGAGIFRRLGGFDEALRMTEDTDLGYRAEQGGVPIRYCAGAVGYHNHPKTLDQRCAYMQSTAFWTTRLLAKHPQMAPLLPIYQDILPLACGQDSVSLVVRKLGRRGLALPLSRKAMRLLICILEDRWPVPALLRSLYYKLMNGNRVAGFREGQRRPA